MITPIETYHNCLQKKESFFFVINSILPARFCEIIPLEAINESAKVVFPFENKEIHFNFSIFFVYHDQHELQCKYFEYYLVSHRVFATNLTKQEAFLNCFFVFFFFEKGAFLQLKTFVDHATVFFKTLEMSVVSQQQQQPVQFIAYGDLITLSVNDSLLHASLDGSQCPVGKQVF